MTTPLIAGDIRRPGDAWRHKDRNERDRHQRFITPGPWVPVPPLMHGKEILPSDLMHLDFRRPV